jgi:hypothetical protein
MGADMMARTLYLPADTTIDLTAAKATASQLSQQATLEDLRTLLEYGWIADDGLPDDCGDDDRAARAGHLRQLAEQELHQLLDRFAQSLHTRDVSRFRFGRDDTPGLDAYTTGGLSHGDGPTDAFDDWDVVFDDVRLPMRWPAQHGARPRAAAPVGRRPRSRHGHPSRLELTAGLHVRGSCPSAATGRTDAAP